MKKLTALAAVLCMVPLSASAWVAEVIGIHGSGTQTGRSYYLANGYTGTSIPESNGTDIAGSAAGLSTLAFYPSGTGAYSCTIYGDSRVVSNTDADLSDNGYVLGSVSSTSGPLIYANAEFWVVWVSCGTNPSNDVTVIMQGTP